MGFRICSEINGYSEVIIHLGQEHVGQHGHMKEGLKSLPQSSHSYLEMIPTVTTFLNITTQAQEEPLYTMQGWEPPRLKASS